MTTTILAMNLAWTVCTARFGAGLMALPYFTHECASRLSKCLEAADGEAGSKACIESSWRQKICDGAGNCF